MFNESNLPKLFIFAIDFNKISLQKSELSELNCAAGQKRKKRRWNINSETFDYSNILTSDNSLDYCNGNGRKRTSDRQTWVNLIVWPIWGMSFSPARVGGWSAPIVPSLVWHFILAARSSASGLRLPHSEKWQKFNDAFKLHVACPLASTACPRFDELYALQCLFFPPGAGELEILQLSAWNWFPSPAIQTNDGVDNGALHMGYSIAQRPNFPHPHSTLWA